MRGVLAGAAMLVMAGCTWLGADPSSVTAPAETMQVSSVSDGDTFTAITGSWERVRVRLLSIDAPETAHDGEPAQCGAEQATQTLRLLIDGQTVSVAGDSVADPIDRFGRRLAYASVEGRDVALALVADGMVKAWYPASESEPDRYRDYRAAERSARAANTGLWATCPSVGR